MEVFVCEGCMKAGVKPIDVAEIENLVRCPWTIDQVKSLARYQHDPAFLPFVCEADGSVLTPSESGSICKSCSFVLDWAYDWTLDWSWLALT